MIGEETKRFYEESYAQLRLDGKTHEQALAIIDAAFKAAIPRAVNSFLDEILGEAGTDNTQRSDLRNDPIDHLAQLEPEVKDDADG